MQSFKVAELENKKQYIKGQTLKVPLRPTLNPPFERVKKEKMVNVSLSEAARVTEAWESYLQTKYGANKSKKDTAAFRDYSQALTVQPTVAAFYKENHEKQTLAHVLAMKEKYGKLDKAELGVWEVLELLNGLLDDSDPDIQMPQMVHALQSAEAARRDGQPKWMVLVALIHDLGKYLYFLGEPQWTVSLLLSLFHICANQSVSSSKRSLVTLSRSAANLPPKSFTQSSLKTIQTAITKSIQQNTASISPTAALRMCI